MSEAAANVGEEWGPMNDVTGVWPNGADYSPRTLYVESKPVVPV